MTLPNGQFKYVYGKTQREVSQKKTDLLMQYGRGVTDFRSVTVEEWAQTWWRVEKKGKTGYSSQVRYTSILNNHIIPALGGFLVRDVRTVHVQELLNDMTDAGKSKDLRAKVRACLVAIFRYAIANGMIFVNPAEPTRVDGKYGAREALTREQWLELREACEGMPGELIIKLAYYLGLRRGEIIGLHWTDLDKKQRTIHVQRSVEFVGNVPHEKSPKTAAGDRVLPVPDALWGLLMQQDRTSVFIAPKSGGGQMTQTAFHNRVQPIFKKLSFKMTLHQLRHTYATQLDLLGVPAKACQYLLGHASPTITKKTYTHTQSEHLARARGLLNQL